MWRAYRILSDERETSYLKGGAGLVSTAADYARFALMMGNNGTLDGRRYLAAPVVNFMQSNHTVGMAGSPMASTGPGYGFGLGFAVRLAGWHGHRAGQRRGCDVGRRLGHQLHHRPGRGAGGDPDGAGAEQPGQDPDDLEEPGLWGDGGEHAAGVMTQQAHVWQLCLHRRFRRRS